LALAGELDGGTLQIRERRRSSAMKAVFFVVATGFSILALSVGAEACGYKNKTVDAGAKMTVAEVPQTVTPVQPTTKQ
jgi:hypothetical protein